MSKVNWRQLIQYREVLGLKKMHCLWQEFLSCSAQCWHNLELNKTKNMIYIFHNWRSSSKVFGMDEFSALCQRIEDNLQKQNHNNFESIHNLRQIYDANVEEVNQYFVKMEQNNER